MATGLGGVWWAVAESIMPTLMMRPNSPVPRVLKADVGGQYVSIKRAVLAISADLRRVVY